ncbi:heterokaryon incompatibility, partial [Paraphoma chrysanthemicola]
YVALSYVWGASTSSRSGHCIQIGKYELRVTRNCEAALFTTLEEEGPIAIWVDSICIDQTSLSERNHQIQLMGCIYERAHTVFVWLSPDSPLLPVSMGYVKTLVGDGRLESSVAKRDILKHLLENEWFSRGWTYQEFVLASNPVFLTHSARLSWTEL